FVADWFIDRFDTLSMLPHLSCPVLLVHGAKDREIPAAHSRMLFLAGVMAHRGRPLKRAEVAAMLREAGADAPASVAAAASRGGSSSKCTEDAASVMVNEVFATCRVPRKGTPERDRTVYASSRPDAPQNSDRGGRRGVAPGPVRLKLVELHDGRHENVQSSETNPDRDKPRPTLDSAVSNVVHANATAAVAAVASRRAAAASMAQNIESALDINETAGINPFAWSGAVVRGQPWILPNESILPVLPPGTGYGCFVSPDLPVGLQLVADDAPLEEKECPLGYFCPYIDPVANPYSAQVMCPTTTRCAIERLIGNHCLAQGSPAGYACKTGTVEPVPCRYMSLCPPGTIMEQHYGIIVVVAVVDVFLAAALLFKRAADRRRAALTSTSSAAAAGRRRSNLQLPGVALHTAVSRSLESVARTFTRLGGGPTAQDELSTLRGGGGGVSTGRDGLAAVAVAGLRRAASALTGRPGTVAAARKPDAGGGSDGVGGAVGGDEEAACGGLDDGGSETGSECIGYRCEESEAASGSGRDSAAGMRHRISDEAGDAADNASIVSNSVSPVVESFRAGLGGRYYLRMNFQFDNLGVTVGGGGGGRRSILQGVSGKIMAGRMTAVIGPSGAGKTTFMHVLMGKLPRTGGSLRINGCEAEVHQFRKIVGYVPQDDVMLKELTVREVITYSARIRLPRDWTTKQVKQHVDAILKVLKHPPPSIVAFHDTAHKPTSGLDSTSALKVAVMLRSISRVGITVVSVIHQPRVEVFAQFDDVLMVAPGGRTAYFGPVALAQPYFSALGFRFREQLNPADVLMDILSGRGRLADGATYAGVGSCGVPISAAAAEAKRASVLRSSVMLQGETEDGFRGGEDSKSGGDMEKGECGAAAAAAAAAAWVGSDWLVDVWERSGQSAVEQLQRGVPPKVVRRQLLRDAHGCSGGGKGLGDAQFGSLQTVAGSGGEAWEDAGVATAVAARQSVGTSTDGLDPQAVRAMHEIAAERGAGMLRQAWCAHQRSVLQQARQAGALATELGVAALAGLIMGVAGYTQETFHGVQLSPYRGLSSAPNEWLLGLYGTLIGVAIALAGGPAGVKTFGEEKSVFWREAAAGHSPLGYYLGKNISTIYRLALASAHFTGVYVFFARPTFSIDWQYLLLFLNYFCVYGMSFVVSAVVRRENAPLVTVILGMLVAIFNGYAPTLADAEADGYAFLLGFGSNRWAAEALYGLELDTYRGVYDMDVSLVYFGYEIGVAARNACIMLALGIGYRAVGFLCLVAFNRNKQR
ncbi:hypothetical protein HK405_001966, partial [Cladochytrium tenue]